MSNKPKKPASSSSSSLAASVGDKPPKTGASAVASSASATAKTGESAAASESATHAPTKPLASPSASSSPQAHSQSGSSSAASAPSAAAAKRTREENIEDLAASFERDETVTTFYASPTKASRAGSAAGPNAYEYNMAAINKQLTVPLCGSAAAMDTLRSSVTARSLVVFGTSSLSV
jgi:hypothetical protein